MTDGRKWTKYDHEREVAEAVVSSFPEVSLHEMRDAPDVDLLHRDGYHVGMEIVRLADERELSLKKRLQGATDLIQNELIAQSVQGVFWVYFDLQEMFEQDDKRAWDRNVPTKLATLLNLRGAVNVENADLLAAGVTCIAHVEAKAAQRTFVGCGWRSTTEAGNSLAEIQLARKQQKLARYRTQNGDRFKQYWLAIASLGPGTLDDGGYSLLLASQFKTDYDRVLLVNHAANGRMVGAQDVTPAGSV